MKPHKEYAKELVQMYFKDVFKGHNKIQDSFEYERSIECALIDVQNTIDAFPKTHNTVYFEQVKTEIINLK